MDRARRGFYGLTEKERKSQIFRRSLYITEDLAAGDALTESNLRNIRPGLGLPPKYLGTLIGKRVGRAVRRGTPMSWDLLTSAEDNIAPSRQDSPRNARA